MTSKLTVIFGIQSVKNKKIWRSKTTLFQHFTGVDSSGFVLDLSKTCPLVASADTDLSVYLACLRHVLDKSAGWSLGM